MTNRKAPAVAAFIEQDFGDANLDLGEPWYIGTRKTSVADIGGTSMPPKDGKKPEDAKVDVLLMVRRMPRDMWKEITDGYSDTVPIKDFAGNEKNQKVLTAENSQLAVIVRLKWMWVDTKNLVMGVGDDEVAALYTSALGREVKKGDLVLLDGHLSDTLKDHLINRYAIFREQLTGALNEFDKASTFENKPTLLGN